MNVRFLSQTSRKIRNKELEFRVIRREEQTRERIIHLVLFGSVHSLLQSDQCSSFFIIQEHDDHGMENIDEHHHQNRSQ